MCPSKCSISHHIHVSKFIAVQYNYDQVCVSGDLVGIESGHFENVIIAIFFSDRTLYQPNSVSVDVSKQYRRPTTHGRYWAGFSFKSLSTAVSAL